MDLKTLRNYKSNIVFIQRLTLAMFVLQLLASTFHLFIPRYIEVSILSPVSSIGIGILILIVGTLIGARVVDLEGEKLIKIFRVITFAGLIQQHGLGMNTIYTITIFILALIGENLLVPKLEIIERTQNYASRDKLTTEVYDAVVHADNYLEEQLRWITNTMIALIVVAILSIFLITIFNILPVLLQQVQYIQIFAIIALIGLFGVIIYRGFPQFEEPKSEYDFDIN